ncbi:AMP-binding protein [soil metagenome]
MSDAELSIGEGLAALAAADPDRPAVIFGDRMITRAQLEARTNRLAREYIALGVTPDSLVTIGLPNGIEFVEATIATWKAGATPQPVSDRLPTRERTTIIELADPSLVVGVDPSEVGTHVAVPAGHEPDPSLDDGPLEPRIARSIKAPTSGGSTGRPKIIVSTLPATLFNANVHQYYTNMVPDGVQLVTGPQHHNGPFMYGFAGVLIGATIVIMPRFDAARTLELIEQYRIDWVYAVPTMMSRILALPDEERLGRDLSSLQILFHMAAPCPPSLKQAYIDWLGADRIWELYGGTEGMMATIITGTQWLEHPGSVGIPLGGELEIRDTDGNVVGPDVTGHVWMRSADHSKPTYEYIGAESHTADEGWECLGDIGRLDADGFLYLSDRETDMIVVGGSNVYPAEVEAALAEHPAVSEACVIGLPHEDKGSAPHAILNLVEPVTDAELVTHLRERLVGYKLPVSFERLDEPLRDDAGKVRRSALRADRLAGAATA